MNAIIKSFKAFIKQLTQDGMLVMILIAPFLIGSIFKFGLPFLELQLTDFYDKEIILSDYFILFDLLLLTLTPYLLCFAASMTMLDEYDSNLINHLCITPLGKKGYLISRVIFPISIAYVISVLVILVFSITNWTFPMILTISFLTCLLSLTVTLIVFSFSKNKIEGLVLAKLSGIIMIGIIVPFTITSNVQYYFSIFPSFWIAKFLLESNIIYFILSVLSITIWIYVLYKKFNKKLSS